MSSRSGQRSSLRLGRWIVGVVACLVGAGSATAIPEQPAVDPETGQTVPFLCPTTDLYYERVGISDDTFRGSGCPTEGACDVPATRDGTSTSAKTVNVIVHVMNSSSGQGPSGVGQAEVDAGMAQLAADYAGTGISFNLVATRFHNDNDFHCITKYHPYNSTWYADILAMKDQYAEDPANSCNIFISCQDSSPFGVLLGIGTFPWDPDALTNRGGLWMNSAYWGAGQKTAAHEMGHCLGLWHTHHGVSEVTSCGSCYEFASGVEGDVRGDFCSDTPPTPTNYNCSPPGGSDCQGTAWGATQPENYMGYAPDSCYDTFTSQQVSRMHCWSAAATPGWLSGCEATGPPTAPTGLSATAASDTEIDLSWTDASSDEDQFAIERDSGGGFTQIATVGANTTSYHDSGLTCDTSYSYRVSASNCAGTSAYSNTATTSTDACPPADAVHVGAVSLSIVQQGPWTRARTTVSVHTSTHGPQANATVTGTYAGTTSSTESGVTDGSGQVTLDSDRVRNASSYCWAFTVTGVSGAGLTYDAGANEQTCDEDGNSCTAGCDGSRLARSTAVNVDPNPFHTDTHIGFWLETGASVELGVFDVNGREIRSLASGFTAAGLHHAEWDGRDESGNAVPGGIYFYRLRTPSEVHTGRLVIIR